MKGPINGKLTNILATKSVVENNVNCCRLFQHVQLLFHNVTNGNDPMFVKATVNAKNTHVTISLNVATNMAICVTTPLLEKCEDDTHTPEMGSWASSGTPKTLKFDCKGQNTSPWSVFHVIGKLLKCRCLKWPCMSHLDICSTSYSKKKGRESNWQFDSRPLKVGNWPDLGVCRWSATHCWKALNESYKLALDLIPIWGLRKELWTHKVQGIQTKAVSGLLLGSLGTKSHSNVGATE